jgi:hypothetical protein
MQIETYDRKPFSVKAVQVNFENVYEVAEWCKGTVIKQKTKMLGVQTDVPAVKVEGQGDNRGKSFIATLGCYVVELKGSFRVYKPAQFDSSFEKPVEIEHLIKDDKDESPIENENKSYATDISLMMNNQ